jgi:hypothetical protein
VSERPILHVTNFASRKLHGGGLLLHIMARPPAFVRNFAAGFVTALKPSLNEQELMQSLVRRRKAGEAIAEDDAGLIVYRDTYTARLRRELSAARSAPDGARPWPTYWPNNGASMTGFPIRSGVTLVCTCSVAEANAGRCHRVWAAAVLVEAGYAVMLDGKPFTLGFWDVKGLALHDATQQLKGGAP